MGEYSFDSEEESLSQEPQVDSRYTYANMVYKVGAGCVTAGTVLGFAALGGLAGYLCAQLIDPKYFFEIQDKAALEIMRTGFDLTGACMGVLGGISLSGEAAEKIHDRVVEPQWDAFRKKYVPDRTFASSVESLDEVVDETTDTAS